MVFDVPFVYFDNFSFFVRDIYICCGKKQKIIKLERKTPEEDAIKNSCNFCVYVRKMRRCTEGWNENRKKKEICLEYCTLCSLGLNASNFHGLCVFLSLWLRFSKWTLFIIVVIFDCVEYKRARLILSGIWGFYVHSVIASTDKNPLQSDHKHIQPRTMAWV